MHEAVHGVHGEMLRHYETWLWIINNMMTGLSYVIIGAIIAKGWPVQPRFTGLFAAFIIACGVHHLVHALPGLVVLPHGVMASMQIIADVTMASVSALTAALVYRDWRRHGVTRG